jgi:hypothetical protein
MESSKGTSDFINLLQNVLEDAHLQICTWKTKLDFEIIKASTEAERNLPNFLNEETLEAIQNPLKRDVSSTKAASCEDQYMKRSFLNQR